MNKRMTSKYRYKKKNGHGNVGAVIIFLISFMIIGGLSYVYMAAQNLHDGVDQETFCRKTTPTAVTAILIDHTDAINPTQKAALEVRLWDVAKSIPKYSKIKVYSVSNTSKKVLEPEIELCNPGNGNETSQITGNPELVEKRYEDKFKKPISEILDRIVSSRGSNESPIMESLQSVAVTSFLGEDKDAAKKRLILVSDLLEHTDKFSLYKSVPDFDIYKSSPHWKSVRADLSDVDIEIYTLRRDGHGVVQNNKLMSFWMDFFTNQGAHIKHTVLIEG